MKRYIFSLVFFFSLLAVCAQSEKTQNLSAKYVITQSAQKPSVEESISYLKKSIEKISAPSEKRIVYTFLAEVQEQYGLYSDAQKSYALAAGFQGSGGNDFSLPYKSSEQLVVDAVRCALCAGDYASADSYLASAVRNSKDEKIIACVKLYEQWSALCKAKNEAETKESVTILKAYSDLDSMKSVKASVLLTLWHLTGDKTYSDRLKKAFPNSMEASIVRGEVQILPTPFWYFVPRSGVDLPEIKAESSVGAAEVPEVANPKNSDSKNQSSKNNAASEKIVKQQLGLFKDKANANSLVEKVTSKGFKAKIEEEVRPSGTTYYLVVVDENKEGSIGKELRTAGFECYPLFSE